MEEIVGFGKEEWADQNKLEEGNLVRQESKESGEGLEGSADRILV